MDRCVCVYFFLAIVSFRTVYTQYSVCNEYMHDAYLVRKIDWAEFKKLGVLVCSKVTPQDLFNKSKCIVSSLVNWFGWLFFRGIPMNVFNRVLHVFHARTFQHGNFIETVIPGRRIKHQAPGSLATHDLWTSSLYSLFPCNFSFRFVPSLLQNITSTNGIHFSCCLLGSVSLLFFFLLHYLRTLGVC